MFEFSMSMFLHDCYVLVYVYTLSPYSKYAANSYPSLRTPSRRLNGQRRIRRRGRRRRLRSSRLMSRERVGELEYMIMVPCEPGNMRRVAKHAALSLQKQELHINMRSS